MPCRSVQRPHERRHPAFSFRGKRTVKQFRSASRHFRIRWGNFAVHSSHTAGLSHHSEQPLEQLHGLLLGWPLQTLGHGHVLRRHERWQRGYGLIRRAGYLHYGLTYIALLSRSVTWTSGERRFGHSGTVNGVSSGERQIARMTLGMVLWT